MRGHATRCGMGARLTRARSRGGTGEFPRQAAASSPISLLAAVPSLPISGGRGSASACLRRKRKTCFAPEILAAVPEVAGPKLTPLFVHSALLANELMATYRRATTPGAAGPAGDRVVPPAFALHGRGASSLAVRHATVRGVVCAGRRVEGARAVREVFWNFAASGRPESVGRPPEGPL